MRDASVLDLATLHPSGMTAVDRHGFMGAWAYILAIGTACLLVASAFAMGAFHMDLAKRILGLGGSDQAATLRLPLEQLRQAAIMSVDDKAQLVAEGQDAVARNASIPLSAAPLDHVAGYQLQAANTSVYSNALKCLTQAVYYEAALEPLQGRRAVAQVVLNRMRHPAYPKSVCGVVYQGSERRTGCQFSFTCDGSLLRAPAVGPWKEAQAVAREALAGSVERSVGTATHYHADYVLPKWAFQLAKIEQLGRHIFYRFNGAWGRARAFNGIYSGSENIPSINYALLEQRLSETDRAGVESDLTPGLTVPPHITDRHAETDVGGRLDVTLPWRLTIPDPKQVSSRYQQAVGSESGTVNVALRSATTPEQEKMAP